MKKRRFLAPIFAVALAIALLGGCSSGPKYKVSVTKPLYFEKEQATPFQVKVTKDKQAAKGLKISVELSMANMDHGSETAQLKEEQNGLYSGTVKLPMTGDYEMAFSLKNGGEKAETVIHYTVKKPSGVAAINGKWIKQEDLQFFQLLNKLQLAINRDAAVKKYSGAQLEEELAYLDSQEKVIADKNRLLTEIIRLRAAVLLANEKGHKADPAQIQTAVLNARSQYAQHEAAQKLIQQYGEERFWKMEEQHAADLLLSQLVEKDLQTQVKKENPAAADQEIRYLAQQQYEDLLVSEMNSLKIQIL